MTFDGLLVKIDIFHVPLLLIFPRLLSMENFLLLCFLGTCMDFIYDRSNIPLLFDSIKVLDDKNVRRRFRASNYQSTTRVKPFICTMPMRLDEGWNQIQFNLSDFTRRAYGTNYVETLRVQIHANCRIRRVYFSDRLYSEDELPAEFKLFLPIQKPQQSKVTAT
jgi:Protein of unknown function (DUF667)